MRYKYLIVLAALITAPYLVAQETEKAVFYDVRTPLKPLSAEASTTQSSDKDKEEDFFAANAIDEDPATRWSSNFSEPQWLMIDLGRICEVDKINIKWESAYATSYRIEVSTDKDKWTEVCSTREGKGDVENIIFKPQKTRYIKINCLKRKGQWGFSIWDVSVYEKKRLVLF
jgi:mannan endo-1,4-beta-mannosidase